MTNHNCESVHLHPKFGPNGPLCCYTSIALPYIIHIIPSLVIWSFLKISREYHIKQGRKCSIDREREREIEREREGEREREREREKGRERERWKG